MINNDEIEIPPEGTEAYFQYSMNIEMECLADLRKQQKLLETRISSRKKSIENLLIDYNYEERWHDRRIGVMLSIAFIENSESRRLDYDSFKFLYPKVFQDLKELKFLKITDPKRPHRLDIRILKKSNCDNDLKCPNCGFEGPFDVHSAPSFERGPVELFCGDCEHVWDPEKEHEQK